MSITHRALPVVIVSLGLVLGLGLVVAAASDARAQTGGTFQPSRPGPQNLQGTQPNTGQPGSRAPGAPGNTQPANGISGRYAVSGRNVDGSRYNGTVIVNRTGQIYRVYWVIGAQRYRGVGILTGDVLSVAYNGGLAAYRVDGSTLRGTWTTTRGGRLSTENWSR